MCTPVAGDSQLVKDFKKYMMPRSQHWKEVQQWKSGFHTPWPVRKDYEIGPRGGVYYVNARGHKTYATESRLENLIKDRVRFVTKNPLK